MAELNARQFGNNDTQSMVSHLRAHGHDAQSMGQVGKVQMIRINDPHDFDVTHHITADWDDVHEMAHTVNTNTRNYPKRSK